VKWNKSVIGVVTQAKEGFLASFSRSRLAGANKLFALIAPLWLIKKFFSFSCKFLLSRSMRVNFFYLLYDDKRATIVMSFR
jgi:hypothetical protein